MIESLYQSAQHAVKDATLLAFPLVFLAGVLTSFTPCVYPMIPITAGYIGAKGAGSRRKGFFLSLCYVFGMAVMYSALGAFAALTGKLFGTISTSPAILFIVGSLCVLLGLNMMDVFQIPIPQFFAFRQTSTSGGYAGAFLVGVAAGTIAAPCTAPVLFTLLTLVAQRKDLVYGISLLFVFSLGLGFLLMLVGTFASLLTSLPKTGAWTEKIKKGLGFAMLAIGGYFLYNLAQLFT